MNNMESALDPGVLQPAPPPASPAGSPIRESLLDIEGVTCSACVTRVEGALNRVPGVRDASLNLTTRRAFVRWDPDKTRLEDLFAAVARAGYRARVASSRRVLDESQKREKRMALWRLSIAGFAMMQIMMFAIPAYVAEGADLTWDIDKLFKIASLLMTIPVLVFSATPIFRAALNGLRARQPGMDVPVALGISVSFVASLWGTFRGGEVYYDSIAMFVFFLLTGRYFESMALAKAASATESLLQMVPATAARLDGWPASQATSRVPVATLVPGDSIMVATGESIPADATVLAGESDCDESLVTGESLPVSKAKDAKLLAGSLNLSAPLVARVDRAGEDNTLAIIGRMVERAAADKPPWVQAADRIASHFVIVVLSLAAFGAVAWMWIDPDRALWVAVATLVATCPCALSLATPVALSSAINALARRGVLVTRGSAIETLSKATHFVFDKTGTLTSGRMRLARMDLYGDRSRDWCLSVAAALESAMPHPIAHAIAAAGASAGNAPLLDDVRTVPGKGVEARLGNEILRIGSPSFAGELHGLPLPEGEMGDLSVAALASESGWLALMHLEDAPREDARELVSRLKAEGIEVSMLSGDRQAVVDSTAKALGIEHFIAGANPDEKLRYVEALAAKGAIVAMVGDGLNDAPVLGRASVAIVLGSGTALAQSQADLVILNPSLNAVAESRAISLRTVAIIRENIVWAIAYNAVSLPLALSGWLTPWLASLGMSLSSLLVVGNALRLLRDPGRKATRMPASATA
jgi:Cu2+-exporting ATPase